MERKIYTRMAAIEDRHWWFVARRRILEDDPMQHFRSVSPVKSRSKREQFVKGQASE